LSDKYSAYFSYAKDKQITQSCCWAHARRKFTELIDVEPEFSKAALNYIRDLYKIEKDIKGLSLKEKLQIRDKESTRIVNEYFKFLINSIKKKNYVPSNLFLRAANYSLGIEKELMVYLSNSEVPIDNNHVEREIRPIAIGRKNWMFCFTELGARNSAILYSLVSSCRILNINSYDYLVDVLQRVQVHPNSQVQELIPRKWIDNQEIQNNKFTSIVD